MNKSEKYRQFHITVRGIVQGVYFRASTQEQAKKLQLIGWVRNTSDGNVELMAQGSTEQLDIFMRWLHKGPPAATVNNLECYEVELDEFDGFEVRY